MTYLDWAASAPPEPRALEQAREVSSLLYANPSSPHAAGRAAAERLAGARAALAAALGAAAGEILFTSGATESNTALLLSLLARLRLGGARQREAAVVTTALEHASVYEQARALEGFGFGCTAVQPRESGHVAPSAVAEAVGPDTSIVSVMLVNNETGAVQDVAGITAAVREVAARSGRLILVHTDAVQGLGKISFSVRGLGVDAASFSGHKLGAPRGVGGLFLARGAPLAFLPLGGGQEKGMRPGTENLAGACALACAAGIRLSSLSADLAAARRRAARLMAGVRSIPGGRLFPEGRGPADEGYSPWIVSIGFPPLPGEVVVRLAESRGYLVSMGAACSSRKKDRTRVLQSMGLDAGTALCAVRVSTGPTTSDADIDGLLDVFSREVAPLRAMSRGKPA